MGNPELLPDGSGCSEIREKGTATGGEAGIAEFLYQAAAVFCRDPADRHQGGILQLDFGCDSAYFSENHHCNHKIAYLSAKGGRMIHG